MFLDLGDRYHRNSRRQSKTTEPDYISGKPCIPASCILKRHRKTAPAEAAAPVPMILPASSLDIHGKGLCLLHSGEYWPCVRLSNYRRQRGECQYADYKAACQGFNHVRVSLKREVNAIILFVVSGAPHNPPMGVRNVFRVGKWCLLFLQPCPSGGSGYAD